MRELIACLLLLLLPGCLPQTLVKGSYVVFDPSEPLVPVTRSVQQVEVFYQEEPKRPYEEIGIVEAVARGYEVSLSDLLPELKRQAALMGSDAIHKVDLRRYDHAGEAMHATAVGIRYTAPATTTPAATGPAATGPAVTAPATR